MNNQTINSITEASFKEFLLINKRNRFILLIASVAIIIQFSIFKYFYPFASYIHGDSFSYINAAYDNSNINTYLIGYSKFLRLISVFSKSDLVLTFFQFLIIQSSGIFLLFTLFYFYNINKIIQIATLIFFIFNPLFWHLGNLISSDGLFLALSLLWFALLLWIIHKPSTKVIIWHALVLLIAFTVRYNAMIYPFISIIPFSLSNLTLRKKLSGMGLGIMLCTVFIVFTSYQYKKITGYWQYSPFSGWQLANNAMYAYRYVDRSERKPVPIKFHALDNMVREFFDSTRNTKRFITESVMASTFYMWSPGMPLMDYRNKQYKNDTSVKDFTKWAAMGPFYKEYGLYIINKYPKHFLRYFIWPNANKYYAPPVEFLESYNSGKNKVTPVAKIWFNYKTINIKSRFMSNKVQILSFYPILSGVLNISMICFLICFCLLKGWKYNHINKVILIGSTFWFSNACFTIFASSAALRFQSFPIILTAIMVGVFVDWIIRVIELIKQDSAKSALTKNKNSHSIVNEIVAQ